MKEDITSLERDENQMENDRQKQLSQLLVDEDDELFDDVFFDADKERTAENERDEEINGEHSAVISGETAVEHSSECSENYMTDYDVAVSIIKEKVPDSKPKAVFQREQDDLRPSFFDTYNVKPVEDTAEMKKKATPNDQLSDPAVIYEERYDKQMPEMPITDFNHYDVPKQITSVPKQEMTERKLEEVESKEEREYADHKIEIDADIFKSEPEVSDDRADKNMHIENRCETKYDTSDGLKLLQKDLNGKYRRGEIENEDITRYISAVAQSVRNAGMERRLERLAEKYADSEREKEYAKYFIDLKNLYRDALYKMKGWEL